MVKVKVSLASLSIIANFLNIISTYFLCEVYPFLTLIATCCIEQLQLDFYAFSHHLRKAFQTIFKAWVGGGSRGRFVGRWKILTIFDLIILNYWYEKKLVSSDFFSITDFIWNYSKKYCEDVFWWNVFWQINTLNFRVLFDLRWLTDWMINRWTEMTACFAARV